MSAHLPRELPDHLTRPRPPEPTTLDPAEVRRAVAEAAADDQYDRGYRRAIALGQGVRDRQLVELRRALAALVDAARTSGGVAGRDDALCAACERAESVLQRTALAERNIAARPPAPPSEDAR